MTNERKHMKGRYKLKNPEKYRGDGNAITWRSLWEHQAMSYFDRHPNVLEWSSEEVKISYYFNRHRNYWPDFWARVVDSDGNTADRLIEVKPAEQATSPMNKAKWKAAREWCAENDADFVVLTSKEIYGEKV